MELEGTRKRRERWIVAALSAAAGILVLSFFVPGAVGILIQIGLVVLFPLALILLGTASARPGARLVLTLLLLGSLLLLSFGSLFCLHRAGGEAVQLAGVPAGAVLQLAGLWLLPFLVVGFGYALSFARHGLRDEDLARIERLREGAE